MAATRPIIFDPIEDGRPSPEDTARLILRERARPIGGRPLVSNRLGNALAGFRDGAAVRLRGGRFTPSATSGML